MNFITLQNELKRGATRDQGGTIFDTAAKNLLNRALKRLAQETLWRSLRRECFFTTSTGYTVGSGSASISVDSDSLTVTGASFISGFTEQSVESQNQIPTVIGRTVKIQGSNTKYTVRRAYGDQILALDKPYDGNSNLTTGTYSINPQETYVLPMQVSHRMFMWHEELGFPYQMIFITDQDFYNSNVDRTTQDTPTHYRMWQSNMTRQPITKRTTISVVSDSASDLNISIRVQGTTGVQRIPNFETIVTNGTTSVSGTKEFGEVDRVSKSGATVGTITVSADNGNTILAIIPPGEATEGVQYKYVSLYPIPKTTFPMNIWYYKTPYNMVDDNDVHELGQDFDEALIVLATAMFKKENNMSEWKDDLSYYKDLVRILKKTNVDKPDWFPNLRRPYESRGTNSFPRISRFLGYNQVGSNYGPSTRF